MMRQGLIVALLATVIALSEPVNALRFLQAVPRRGLTAQGEFYRRGYALAASEYEDRGGLKWGSENNIVPIEIETLEYNSSSEVYSSLDAFLGANSQTDEEPIIVFGGYGSSVIRNQVAATDKHETLMINGGGATSSIYAGSSVNRNKLAFGLLSSVSTLATTTMDFMKEQMDQDKLSKPIKMALLWEDAAHGISYKQEVVRYSLMFPDYFEIVYASDFQYPNSFEKEDFSSLVDDIVSTHKRLIQEGHGDGIDALLVDAHSSDFVNLHNAFTAANMDFSFVTYGARGADASDILRLDDPSSANNMVAAAWWSPSTNNVASRSFLRLWRLFEAYQWTEDLAERAELDKSALFELTSSQLPAEWYGALGYQAAKIMFEAVDNCEIKTKQGIQSYLQESTFQTILPTGEIQFNEYGQADNDFNIIQAKVEASSLNINDFKVTAETLFPVSEKSEEFESRQQDKTFLQVCKPSNVGTRTSLCDDANQRTVTFFWVDSRQRACDFEDIPCNCRITESFELPKAQKLACEFLSKDTRDGSILLSLASISGVFCFCALIVTLYFYNNNVMKAGQREFLVLMAIAGIWCNIAASSFLGQNDDEMCLTRVFSLLSSITLLLSALTVKVYRIYRIWNNSSMKRVIVTVEDMIKLLVVLLAVELIICVLWFAFEKPHMSREVIKSQAGQVEFEVSVQVCVYYVTNSFPSASLVYVFSLLIFCNAISFQSRNSDSKYMESRSIMFASYCFTFIFVITIALLATTDLPTASVVLLVSLSLSFTSVVFILLILGPKMYFVMSPGLSMLTATVKRPFVSNLTGTNKASTNALTAGCGNIVSNLTTEQASPKDQLLKQTSEGKQDGGDEGSI
mmetsp:Transcript_16705/g.29575  ORF Transcript_16705/g.29575 Transcript_16705/m.29575 type:complete len:857 (-) Transcript_16705:70-2640(-)